MSERRLIGSFAIFFSFLFMMAKRGYRFGVGDHVTQLPSALHFFNPHLYTRDFKYQMISPWYIKSSFHILLYWISRKFGIPVEEVYFVVHCVVVFLCIFAVYRLSLLVSNNNRIAAIISVILLTPLSAFFPSISHFKVMVNRLVPYNFVLPIAVLSVYFFLKNSFAISSILSAIVFVFHEQIGIILFVSLSFCFLYLFATHKISGNVLLIKWFAPFLLLVTPLCLFILFAGHKGYPWFSLSWGKELLEMVRFRCPHHLLLSYSSSKFIFCFLITLFFSIIYPLIRTDTYSLRIALVSICLLFICIIGAIFTELLPIPLAFNLYAFRGDVIMRIFGLIFFSVLLSEVLGCLPVALRNVCLCGLILVVVILTFLEGGSKSINIYTPKKELYAISTCIRENTPVSSLLITPPYIGGIRFYSERSILASYKMDGLFLGRDVAEEWFRRIKILCGIVNKNPKCLRWQCLRLCRKGYDGLSKSELLEIANHYKADFLLVRKDKKFDFPVVCMSKHYVLYAIGSNGR